MTRSTRRHDDAADDDRVDADARHPALHRLGELLRTLRARRAMTRKELSLASGVSERYLASLESGRVNPSLVVLEQVARGLDSPVAALVGDVTTRSPEWLLIRDLLGECDDAQLQRVRAAIVQSLGYAAGGRTGVRRIALIGLRGAGKTTLGRWLSEDLDLPFVELSAHIEAMFGCSIREIHELYGPTAYRRYERSALEELLRTGPDCVIAVPGGVVAEPATFSLLLGHCLTVWLRATPEDHMRRVARQGDLRPMAGQSEAMDDLRRILRVREAFYAKADVGIDTSAGSLDDAFDALRSAVRERIGQPMASAQTPAHAGCAGTAAPPQCSTIAASCSRRNGLPR